MLYVFEYLFHVDFLRFALSKLVIENLQLISK